MSQSIYDKLSEERKEMQAKGLVPGWYITAGYQLFKDKYLYEADSIKEQFERIANTAAKHLKGIGLEETAKKKFFELFWNGWLAGSTPVLSNMGTDRGLPVSCSGGNIDDSIDGFYSARKEIALLTKYGFGTSAYLGKIRPRGSKISVGGTASGSLPVFKGIIQDMRDVAQGSTRRGSCAAYIEMEHGDFDEIADFIMAEPDDANIGWIITDDFNARLNAKDPDAIRRIQKTLKLKMVRGKGYYSKIDEINRHRPQMYVDKEMYVKASNLCFTGDTLVATAVGNVKISDLAKTSNGIYKFQVYSAQWSEYGEEWIQELKPAVAFKTSDKTHVVNVLMSDGSSFKCTPDHLLASVNGSYIKARDAVDQLIQSFTSENDHQKVVSVEDAGFEAVYDLTVEDNHNFSIVTPAQSWLLVHNCDEITLFADDEHTFTCVLSSMNVAKWHEWKNTDAVYWATIFLDCVAEELIQRGKKIPGLEKAVRFTEKGRALGLGQCGFHTLLQQDSLPFEEMGAYMLNIQIAKHIFDESLKASQWMAKELGEPEWCVGYGVRNTHRIAVAPTKAASSLCGGVSEGINPDPAMTYLQTGAGGEMDRTNPVLLKLMKYKGVYTKKHIKEISEKQGSVQHVNWLTEDEKKVFKTAFEINQEVVLRLASARAPYIDQWQSLNTFFAADEDPAWIAHIHRLAFNDSSNLGLYYITTAAGVQGSTECLACQ